jgi:hypothetical protein
MVVDASRFVTREMDVPEAVNARLRLLWQKYGPVNLPRTIKANRTTLDALTYAPYRRREAGYIENDYGRFALVADEDMPTGHLLLCGDTMAVLIGPEW